MALQDATNQARDNADRQWEEVHGSQAYNVDQLTAMRWSYDIWQETSASTITHCCQHTDLLPPARDEDVERQRTSCDSSVHELVPCFNVMSIQYAAFTLKIMLFLDIIYSENLMFKWVSEVRVEK